MRPRPYREPKKRGRPKKDPRQGEKKASGNIEATRIFYDNFDAKAPVIINRGGSGSSKSYSICQLLAYKFFTERQKKILILRKSLPYLRISTLLVWNEILGKLGVRHLVQEEKVNLNFYFGDSFVHFGSVDDPEKIKSTEWNYIWMEEATEFSYDDFRQLKLRLRAPSLDGKTNQMFLSFNPIDEYHWIKEKLVDEATEYTKEIHSTYKDNPYLPPDYVAYLENLESQDIGFFNIYTLGHWGKLENIIYKYGVHWDIVDTMPTTSQCDKHFYGMDFGFNAPAAIVHVMMKGREVWLEELVYERGLTNPQLIEKAERLIPTKRTPIYADSAEPDRIKEFTDAGFNVKPALKNVVDGIDAVKSFRVHVHKDSPNLIREKRAYSWRKDRQGRVLDEPVPFLDHLMDAERYAIYTVKRSGANLRITMLG